MPRIKAVSSLQPFCKTESNFFILSSKAVFTTTVTENPRVFRTTSLTHCLPQTISTSRELKHCPDFWSCQQATIEWEIIILQLVCKLNCATYHKHNFRNQHVIKLLLRSEKKSCTFFYFLLLFSTFKNSHISSYPSLFWISFSFKQLSTICSSLFSFLLLSLSSLAVLNVGFLNLC